MKQAKESYSEKDLLTVAETIEVYVFRNFTICGKVANTGERFFSEIALRIYGEIPLPPSVKKSENQLSQTMSSLLLSIPGQVPTVKLFAIS